MAAAVAGGRGRVGVPPSASSTVPQDMEKRASGGAGEPQFGQRRSSAVPQLMQNRAPAGFSVPQEAQVISPRLGHPTRVPVDLRDLSQEALVDQRELPSIHLDQRAGMGR